MSADVVQCCWMMYVAVCCFQILPDDVICMRTHDVSHCTGMLQVVHNCSVMLTDVVCC